MNQIRIKRICASTYPVVGKTYKKAVYDLEHVNVIHTFKKMGEVAITGAWNTLTMRWQ